MMFPTTSLLLCKLCYPSVHHGLLPQHKISLPDRIQILVQVLFKFVFLSSSKNSLWSYNVFFPLEQFEFLSAQGRGTLRFVLLEIVWFDLNLVLISFRLKYGCWQFKFQLPNSVVRFVVCLDSFMLPHFKMDLLSLQFIVLFSVRSSGMHFIVCVGSYSTN